MFFLVIGFLLFLTPYYFYPVYPPDFVERLLILETVCIFLVLYLLVNYFKKNNTKFEKLLALERDKVLSDKIILERQEAELRELSEFKSHFFVNLSHEIRTPITLIKGYTSNIDLKDSETQNQKKLNVVRNQIQQIESILNSILDLSKLDANKLKIERSFIEIVPFLNKHFADFKELYNKKSIPSFLTSKVRHMPTSTPQQVE